MAINTKKTKIEVKKETKKVKGKEKTQKSKKVLKPKSQKEREAIIKKIRDKIEMDPKRNRKNRSMVQIYGPSQFRYMALFSIGVSRGEISEYYNVAYETVKKSLQVVCAKFECIKAEDCIEDFISIFGNTKEYKDLVNKYKEEMKKKNIN